MSLRLLSLATLPTCNDARTVQNVVATCCAKHEEALSLVLANNNAAALWRNSDKELEQVRAVVAGQLAFLRSLRDGRFVERLGTLEALVAESTRCNARLRELNRRLRSATLAAAERQPLDSERSTMRATFERSAAEAVALRQDCQSFAALVHGSRSEQVLPMSSGSVADAATLRAVDMAQLELALTNDVLRACEQRSTLMAARGASLIGVERSKALRALQQLIAQLDSSSSTATTSASSSGTATSSGDATAAAAMAFQTYCATMCALPQTVCAMLDSEAPVPWRALERVVAQLAVLRAHWHVRWHALQAPLGVVDWSACVSFAEFV